MTARDTYLRRTYGISESDYESLLHFQGGVCAICRKAPATPTGLVVDHDHRSGRVRGLLCGRQPYRNCNQGLSFYWDSDALFDAAADYLRRPPAASLGLDRVAPPKVKKPRRTK